MPKAGCISGPRSSNRLRAILLKFSWRSRPWCAWGRPRTKSPLSASGPPAIPPAWRWKFPANSNTSPTIWRLPRVCSSTCKAPAGMAQKTIAVGDHLLKQIRIAETQPGTTRIVLDLEQDADFTASQLSNPERLMVELRAKGAKTRAADRTGSGPSCRRQPASAGTPSCRESLPAPAVLTVVRQPVACPLPATHPKPGRSRKRRRAIPTENGP